ncbi:hypothetical protein [Alkalihalobacterium chitinilyticum]|uniref:Uncharacterized protein n=1 Tax=Alkalihalobacterium chitinilyticum TaxID=2980103 RepID=A0ABT5VKH9_9BACI|nr:hypothetical protein [Alkalihalobacterium chitinilyticum]MDE5415953.1 hypothetical protein [Alkalihalobacterium chitinilyticum]
MKKEVLGHTIGIDIPFWFAEIECVNHFGQGILAEWVIKEVDEITVMAYRTLAEDEGGIIDIVSKEIEWANQLNKSVFIAVETVPLPEVHTIFYQKGTDRMNEQERLLICTLEVNPPIKE